jgi:hypothetical protein
MKNFSIDLEEKEKEKKETDSGRVTFLFYLLCLFTHEHKSMLSLHATAKGTLCSGTE